MRVRALFAVLEHTYLRTGLLEDNWYSVDVLIEGQIDRFLELSGGYLGYVIN